MAQVDAVVHEGAHGGHRAAADGVRAVAGAAAGRLAVLHDQRRQQRRQCDHDRRVQLGGGRVQRQRLLLRVHRQLHRLAAHDLCAALRLEISPSFKQRREVQGHA